MAQKTLVFYLPIWIGPVIHIYKATCPVQGLVTLQSIFVGAVYNKESMKHLENVMKYMFGLKESIFRPMVDSADDSDDEWRDFEYESETTFETASILPSKDGTRISYFL